MEEYQTKFSEEASAITNPFHYKYRRRKMMTPQVTSLSLLSLLFITSHLRLTHGFAPTSYHRFNSLVSVSNKRHQLASQRSDDERQSRPAPFFMDNSVEQQQQEQAADTSWNTVQQPNAYTQQQMEDDYYSETAAVNNAQYQSQQDDYYQEAAPEQQQSSTVPDSQSQDDDTSGISSVDARVLESILADGKLDLNSEEEVRKLLEGPRKTEEFRAPLNSNENDEGGKYSSKVISVSLIFLLSAVYFDDITCCHISCSKMHDLIFFFHFHSLSQTINSGTAYVPRDLN